MDEMRELKRRANRASFLEHEKFRAEVLALAAMLTDDEAEREDEDAA